MKQFNYSKKSMLVDPLMKYSQIDGLVSFHAVDQSYIENINPSEWSLLVFTGVFEINDFSVALDLVGIIHTVSFYDNGILSSVIDFGENGLSARNFVGGERYSLAVLAGDDTFESQSASTNADTVFAGDGNDVAFLGHGNDTFYGGNGIDTAKFLGSRFQYNISEEKEEIIVEDNVIDRDGIDTLSSVENLLFEDGVLALDLQRVGDNALIYRMYQAAFARVPDEGGFRYWVNQKVANELSIKSIATSFRASEDFIQKYGVSISNNVYTEALYRNVLQRIPDKEGLVFWQDALNTDRLDRDILLIEFSNSDENVMLTSSNIDNGYWFLA